MYRVYISYWLDIPNDPIPDEHYSEELITRSTLMCTYPVRNNLMENTLLDPKVKGEMGKAGSFEFSMYPTHPYYESLKQMVTMFRVEDDNDSDDTEEWDTLFYGRVLTIDTDYISGLRKVHCEGYLAVLMDTQMEGVEDEKRELTSGKTYIDSLLSNHNATCRDSKANFNPPKRFKTGALPGHYSDNMGISVQTDQRITLPGNTRYGSSSWQDTASAFSNLISYYGGYLRARYDHSDNQVYLDWMDTYFRKYNSAKKPIRVARNVLSMNSTTGVDNLFTYLVPVGSKKGEKIYVKGKRFTPNSSSGGGIIIPRGAGDVDGIDLNAPEVQQLITDGDLVPRGDSSGEVEWDKKYLRVVDAPTMSGYSLDELSEGYREVSDYTQALNNFGVIYKTVSFNDAETPDDLWELGWKYIHDNYYGYTGNFTATAVDLGLLDKENYIPIRVGDHVRVTYFRGMRGINQYIDRTVISIEYDLLNPENNSYTIGIPSGILNNPNYSDGKSGSSSSSSSATAATNNNDNTETNTELEKLKRDVKALLQQYYLTSSIYNVEEYADYRETYGEPAAQGIWKSAVTIITEAVAHNETSQRILQSMQLDAKLGTIQLFNTSAAGPVVDIDSNTHLKDWLKTLTAVTVDGFNNALTINEKLSVIKDDIENNPYEPKPLLYAGLRRTGTETRTNAGELTLSNSSRSTSSHPIEVPNLLDTIQALADGTDGEGLITVGNTGSGDWKIKINDKRRYQDQNGTWHTLSGFITASDMAIQNALGNNIPSFSTKLAIIDELIVGNFNALNARIETLEATTITAKDISAITAYFRKISGHAVYMDTRVRAMDILAGNVSLRSGSNPSVSLWNAGTGLKLTVDPSDPTKYVLRLVRASDDQRDASQTVTFSSAAALLEWAWGDGMQDEHPGDPSHFPLNVLRVTAGSMSRDFEINHQQGYYEDDTFVPASPQTNYGWNSSHNTSVRIYSETHEIANVTILGINVYNEGKRDATVTGNWSDTITNNTATFNYKNATSGSTESGFTTATLELGHVEGDNFVADGAWGVNGTTYSMMTRLVSGSNVLMSRLILGNIPYDAGARNASVSGSWSDTITNNTATFNYKNATSGSTRTGFTTATLELGHINVSDGTFVGDGTWGVDGNNYSMVTRLTSGSNVLITRLILGNIPYAAGEQEGFRQGMIEGASNVQVTAGWNENVYTVLKNGGSSGVSPQTVTLRYGKLNSTTGAFTDRIWTIDKVSGSSDPNRHTCTTTYQALANGSPIYSAAILCQEDGTDNPYQQGIIDGIGRVSINSILGSQLPNVYATKTTIPITATLSGKTYSDSNNFFLHQETFDLPNNQGFHYCVNLRQSTVSTGTIIGRIDVQPVYEVGWDEGFLEGISQGASDVVLTDEWNENVYTVYRNGGPSGIRSQSITLRYGKLDSTTSAFTDRVWTIENASGSSDNYHHVCSTTYQALANGNSVYSSVILCQEDGTANPYQQGVTDGIGRVSINSILGSQLPNVYATKTTIPITATLSGKVYSDSNNFFLHQETFDLPNDQGFHYCVNLRQSTVSTGTIIGRIDIQPVYEVGWDEGFLEGVSQGASSIEITAEWSDPEHLGLPNTYTVYRNSGSSGLSSQAITAVYGTLSGSTLTTGKWNIENASGSSDGLHHTCSTTIEARANGNAVYRTSILCQEDGTANPYQQGVTDGLGRVSINSILGQVIPNENASKTTVPIYATLSGKTYSASNNFYLHQETYNLPNDQGFHYCVNLRQTTVATGTIIGRIDIQPVYEVGWTNGYLEGSSEGSGNVEITGEWNENIYTVYRNGGSSGVPSQSITLRYGKLDSTTGAFTNRVWMIDRASGFSDDYHHICSTTYQALANGSPVYSAAILCQEDGTANPYQQGVTDGIGRVNVNSILGSEIPNAYATKTTVPIYATLSGKTGTAPSNNFYLHQETYDLPNNQGYHYCVNLRQTTVATGTIIGRIDVQAVYDVGLSRGASTVGISSILGSEIPNTNATKTTIPITATLSGRVYSDSNNFYLHQETYQLPNSQGTHYCVNLRQTTVATGTIIGRIDVQPVYEVGLSQGASTVGISSILGSQIPNVYATKTTIPITATLSGRTYSESNNFYLHQETYDLPNDQGFHYCVNLRQSTVSTGTIIGRIDIQAVYDVGRNSIGKPTVTYDTVPATNTDPTITGKATNANGNYESLLITMIKKTYTSGGNELPCVDAYAGSDTQSSNRKLIGRISTSDIHNGGGQTAYIYNYEPASAPSGTTPAALDANTVYKIIPGYIAANTTPHSVEENAFYIRTPSSSSSHSINKNSYSNPIVDNWQSLMANYMGCAQNQLEDMYGSVLNSGMIYGFKITCGSANKYYYVRT